MCFRSKGGVLLGYALRANPTYERRPFLPLALGLPWGAWRTLDIPLIAAHYN